MGEAFEHCRIQNYTIWLYAAIFFQLSLDFIDRHIDH